MAPTTTGSWLWITWPELTVFISGIIDMGLEILTGQVVTPEFDSSIYTRGSIIGVFLAALSLGHHRGGQQAEQASNDAPVHVFIGTATYIVDVIFLGDLFIQSTAGLPTPNQFASLPAITLLLGPSTHFPGFISPYAAELFRRTDVGSASRHVYAVGIVRSIIGVPVIMYVLIPSLSTAGIGLIFGLASVVMAPALAQPEIGREEAAWSVGIAAILVLVSATGDVGFSSHGSIVYYTQTAYQELHVASAGETRTPYLDGQLHSAMGLDDPTRHVFGYTSYLHVPFLLPDDINRVLFVSSGGFTGPYMFLGEYPNVTVDVVKPNPEIVDIAEEHFRVEELSQLSVHTMDDRQYLREANWTYDLIVLDVYQRDRVPFQLTAQEFIQLMSDRLDNDSVLFVDVVSAPSGLASQSYHAEYKMIQSAYPQMYSFPITGCVVTQNIEVMATKGEMLVTAEGLQRRNRNRNIGIDLATELISYRNDEPTDDVSFLTDDHAPADNLLDPVVGQRYVTQRTDETGQCTADRNTAPRSAVAGTAVRAA